MQVVVTFRNIEASEALRDHAEAKLARVNKFMRQPIEAHVVLTVVKHRHVADITVTANRMIFNAAEETDDLYSAIDLAMSKIEKQIKKHSAKRQARKHGAAPAARPAPPRRRPNIRSERVVVKPMSVEEALAEILSSQAEVLVFQNTETDTLTVLYRRKTGTYGMIEPEVE
jgi:putative sigma-54 modulation protein